MLYLTCTTMTSVDLAYYVVSHAKDWVSGDCGTSPVRALVMINSILFYSILFYSYGPPCANSRYHYGNTCNRTERYESLLGSKNNTRKKLFFSYEREYFS